MNFVDTHCHIQSVDVTGGEQHTRELWSKARGLTASKVIAEAAEAGVNKMVCVGCDLEDSKLAIDFAQSHNGCWASIGLHPHEARHYAGGGRTSAKWEILHNKFSEFSGLATKPKVVAVGECGLDYFYGHSPKEAQVEVLRAQLQLAKEHDLPAIFHVREAFDDFWPIYDEYKVRGVLHSFTDTLENLQQAMERQLYIGVNGIVSFTKNAAQLAMYQAIPLQKLLLETDAPFLTPTPYRGTINTPKHVSRVGEVLAQLRGESLGELAAATTQNAHTLFGI